MIVTLILIIVILIGLLGLEKSNTIKLEDKAPENPTEKNCWMQLQNEGGKYIKIKDGKVILKVKK